MVSRKRVTKGKKKVPRITYATLTITPKDDEAYDRAVTKVRANLGAHYSMYINGEKWSSTGEQVGHRSPINTNLVVSYFPKGGRDDAKAAIDAAREVSDAYAGVKTYCAAIGQEIARGSHARALSWHKYINGSLNIPLIRGRYLLYIVLKHKTFLPQDPMKDIQRLFSEFYGWFGQEELIQYFKTYFRLRLEELNKDVIKIPMPPMIHAISKDDDVKKLQKVEQETIKEIRHCFPDPRRKARGDYAVRQKL